MTDKVPPPEPVRQTDLVRRALLQLRAFGDLNQAQVRMLLPMWRHFPSLSHTDMIAIVDAFPEGESGE